MINILSYVGMNMQSEVCLWCLLGLVRTIFDATLFKVNANLKQVWQMTMPAELSMPVQRVLRTMVSGIMLVQCFTVYVYLAAYIVLLYPVFLEERPTLVLPWLLLAAIRKLLCELTSLAVGLGTCVLLGPARPPCIKFVVVKFTSIMPAFYMWMLVFSYYHALKVASAFKTFPAVLPPNDNDYGLELAVRRRRTKSLLGEEQLRKKLVANFYGERSSSITNETYLRPVIEISSRMVHSTDTSLEEAVPETDVIKPLTMSTTGWSDIGAYEDWFGSEVMIPRDTDRILEQIVLMLLRIGAYLKKEGIESIIDSQILNSAVPTTWHQRDNIDCAAINADDTDTPPLVGSSKGNMASYLREYPQIFMKKQGTDIPQTERTIASLKTVHSHIGSEEGNTSNNKMNHPTSDTSIETVDFEVEKVPSKKKITSTDSKVKHEDAIDKLIMPKPLKSKQLAITEGKKTKTKRNKHLDLESQSKENVSETLNKIKIFFQKRETIHDAGKRKYSNSKILNENSNNESPQTKISTNTKTTSSTDSKLITHDKSNEFSQNIIDNNAKTQNSTNTKTLNENKNEESIDKKIFTQDSNKDLTKDKILTNATPQNSKDSKSLQKDRNEKSKDIKILNEGMNNESLDSKLSKQNDSKKLPHSKISTNSNTKNSMDSEILKQGSNSEFIQSEIPTNSKTLHSINSKTLNEDKYGESADSKILKQESNIDFKPSEVWTSAKIQNSRTDSKIITQDSNTQFMQSKTSTNEKTQQTVNNKTFNRNKNKKSIERSTILQIDSRYELTHSKIPTKNSSDGKIMQQDNNKEFVNSKITPDAKNYNLTDSNISNGNKNKEITSNKMSYEEKNKEFTHAGNSKEFPQNIMHIDSSNQSSINSKISNVDKNKKSTASNIEDNNAEFKHCAMSNDIKKQDSTISKTLNEDKRKVLPHNILNIDNSNQLSTNSNISNVGKNRESTLSNTEDNNKEFKHSAMSSDIKKQDSTISMTLNEDKRKELPQIIPNIDTSNQPSTNNEILNVDKNKQSSASNIWIEDKNTEFKQIAMSNDAKKQDSTTSQTSNDDKRKDLMQHNEILNVDKKKQSSATNIWIEDKNTEFKYSAMSNDVKKQDSTTSQTLNEDKRKELMQHILHTDTSNQPSTNSKILNIDNKKESAGSTSLWIEDKLVLLLSGAENQDYTDNKIYPNDNDNESLGTCSCSTLNEENDKEIGNNDTTTPDR